MSKKPIDVVFTWVDDSFDGYSDMLQQYAGDTRDTNPNRTRDNLNILKYGLRSLEKNMPELGHVYLLTCRPQIPAWLNPNVSGITVVHHDEIMDPTMLPTFNSFAIVSHLHKIPGLSEEFLYIEDDMLMMRSGAVDAMYRDCAPLAVFSSKTTKDINQLDPARDSPWNLALANTNAVLSARFKAQKWAYVIHGPKLYKKSSFQAMVTEFAEVFDITRHSRFRAGCDVVPEYLLPHYMAKTGEALVSTKQEAKEIEGYVSLENFWLWTWLQLRYLTFKNPYTATLNDSFENAPNPKVEGLVRRWLEDAFPTPSRFER